MRILKKLKNDPFAYTSISVIILGVVYALFYIYINTTVADIIAIFGLIFTIFFNAFSIRQSVTIQQDTLLHDMVKEEIVNWKYIHEQKEKYGKKRIPQTVANHIFNYYEYLAYLILEEKINPVDAKRIWKPNIVGMYKDFPEAFSGDRVELRKLHNKWKK